MAGYQSKDIRAVGCRLAKKPEIRQYVNRLATMEDTKGIANKEQAKRVCTEIMNDSGAEPKDRISAVARLSKLEGWDAPVKSSHQEDHNYKFVFEKKDGSVPRLEGEVDDNKQLSDDESEGSGMDESIVDAEFTEVADNEDETSDAGGEKDTETAQEEHQEDEEEVQAEPEATGEDEKDGEVSIDDIKNMELEDE